MAGVQNSSACLPLRTNSASGVSDWLWGRTQSVPACCSLQRMPQGTAAAATRQPPLRRSCTGLLLASVCCGFHMPIISMLHRQCSIAVHACPAGPLLPRRHSASASALAAAASPIRPVRASSPCISSCAHGGLGRGRLVSMANGRWEEFPGCTCRRRGTPSLAPCGPPAAHHPRALPSQPAAHLILPRQAGIVLQRRHRPALVGPRLGDAPKARVHRAAVPGRGHQPAQLLRGGWGKGSSGDLRGTDGSMAAGRRYRLYSQCYIALSFRAAVAAAALFRSARLFSPPLLPRACGG